VLSGTTTQGPELASFAGAYRAAAIKSENADVRSRRAVRLAGGGLADSRCRDSLTEKLKPDDGGESRTNHDCPGF